MGYDLPGWHLLSHVQGLEPYDCEGDEWSQSIDELEGLIDARDSDGVLKWFLRCYPRCMALVPRRRRESFLRGVFAAADEGRLR
jgi:hypothetical protein